MAARSNRKPRPTPRADRVPSASVRRRRGPRPPDDVIARLTAALRAELERVLGAQQDAKPEDGAPLGRGRAWRAAILAGLATLGRRARRGVVAALAATPVAAALAQTAPSGLTPTDGDVLIEAALVAVQERARTEDRGSPGWLAALLAAGAAALAAAILALHTRIIRAIARAAGAERYIWTTQRDERVRQLHRELEGTIQRWDTPPLAGLPAFHGHPGEAGGCRCTPYPLVG